MSDSIELDQRDRRNLYKEDADNVFAITASADDEPEDVDIEEAFEKAAEQLHQTGGRRAYIVIRIER